jgi:hypothetical protein
MKCDSYTIPPYSANQFQCLHRAQCLVLLAIKSQLSTLSMGCWRTAYPALLIGLNYGVSPVTLAEEGILTGWKKP